MILGPPNFPVCYMTLFPSEMTLELYFDPMVSDLSRREVSVKLWEGERSPKGWKCGVPVRLTYGCQPKNRGGKPPKMDGENNEKNLKTPNKNS